MRFAAKTRRVLAIDPTSRGFGFAVFEGPTSIIDWGVKSIRTDKGASTLLKVDQLVRHYLPDVVALENHAGKGSRRCCRIRLLIDTLRRDIEDRRVKTRLFSRRQVCRVFAAFGATTKFEIAHAIAQQLPDLALDLPRYRKPWMSEDYRMAIFDAASLALTFYFSLPRQTSRQ